MNSLERLVGILDLFEGPDALLTAEEMHARLGYTRSTLYRYLKVLTGAGLLSSLHSIGYTLGPRIIELDYRIRVRDPLIAASRPLLVQLARDLDGIALLCRKYRDQVLCVHQEASTVAFTSNYERGKARPLFLGAASRVILANLPAIQLRRLFEAKGTEFAGAGIGTTLGEVRTALKHIRMQGFDMTKGQVTPGVVGIAAPVLDASGAVQGSLGVIVAGAGYMESRTRAIAERVMAAAESVGRAISATS